MRCISLLCILFLGLFSPFADAYTLESVLSKDSSRTSEEVVEELEALSEPKRSQIYSEIGGIVGISGAEARKRLQTGDFTTRPCTEEEVLDTAGYDGSNNSLSYDLRYCRGETLILFDEEVVLSAGCGNPSRAQFTRALPVVVAVEKDVDPKTLVVCQISQTRAVSGSTHYSHLGTYWYGLHRFPYQSSMYVISDGSPRYSSMSTIGNCQKIFQTE